MDTVLGDPHLRHGIGAHSAGFELFDILQRAHQPMGLDTAKACVRQMLRDYPGCLITAADALEYLRHQIRCFFGRDNDAITRKL